MLATPETELMTSTAKSSAFQQKPVTNLPPLQVQFVH